MSKVKLALSVLLGSLLFWDVSGLYGDGPFAPFVRVIAMFATRSVYVSPCTSDGVKLGRQERTRTLFALLPVTVGAVV